MNCATVERRCSYPEKSPSSSASPLQSCGTGFLIASPKTPIILAPTFEYCAAQQEDGNPCINLHHLELLHHFSTATYKFPGVDHATAEMSRQIAVKSGLSAPYLMYEILAIAARHLSVLRPTQQEFYVHQATRLQTHAISLFNSTKPDITADNCVSMFLFSSLLGVHVLCDTLAFCDNDFSDFLKRFISYFQLHRGVRAVTSRSWHLLCKTELSPILQMGEALSQVQGIGEECDRLRTLITSADMNQSSIKACQQAVEYLQWVFDAQSKPSGPEDMVHMVFSWPLLVSSGYTDMLLQQRPEALIILAHYAVLLHYCRELWVIGDSGRFLIQHITREVGTDWEEWLAWPNEVLQVSRPAKQNSTTPSPCLHIS